MVFKIGGLKVTFLWRIKGHNPNTSHQRNYLKKDVFKKHTESARDKVIPNKHARPLHWEYIVLSLQHDPVCQIRRSSKPGRMWSLSWKLENKLKHRRVVFSPLKLKPAFLPVSFLNSVQTQLILRQRKIRFQKLFQICQWWQLAGRCWWRHRTVRLPRTTFTFSLYTYTFSLIYHLSALRLSSVSVALWLVEANPVTVTCMAWTEEYTR